MNRREIVLAALAAAGANAHFSPVQVQKLLFLIDREAANFVDGPHFAFAPYDYGPFDRRVYEEITRLEDQRLAITDRSYPYRTYALTAGGYAEGERLLGSLNEDGRGYIKSAASWVRSLSFQQLVAAIYQKYPDMKAKSVFRQ